MTTPAPDLGAELRREMTDLLADLGICWRGHRLQQLFREAEEFYAREPQKPFYEGETWQPVKR